MGFSSVCMGCMAEKGNAAVCSECGWDDSLENGSSSNLPLRTILNNRYLIGRALRQNEYSASYLALDIVHKKKLIVKEYLPGNIIYRSSKNLNLVIRETTHQEEFNSGLGKFMEEGIALQRISYQPGIGQVQDVFWANGTAYRVIEYIDGITFEKYIEKNGGKISFHQLIKVITPVMTALGQVHANGLLHFDIHPRNIIVTRNEIGSLVNFSGAAFVIAYQNKTLRSFLRTGYSPKEFYKDIRTSGPWSDIYSLAATMYRALTGEAPPDAFARAQSDPIKPPSKAGLRLSGDTEASLMKALSIRPQARYQMVKQFKKAITDAWYSTERKSASAALDAFTHVNCPYCGISNEVLKTDLNTGTNNCFACEQPIRIVTGTDISTLTSTTLPEYSDTTDAQVPILDTDVPEKNRIAPSERDDFAIIACSTCGVKSEVLTNDLGMVAVCVHCGTQLYPPIHSKPAPEPDEAAAAVMPSPASETEVDIAATPAAPDIEAADADRNIEEEIAATPETVDTVEPEAEAAEVETEAISKAPPEFEIAPAAPDEVLDYLQPAEAEAEDVTTESAEDIVEAPIEETEAKSAKDIAEAAVEETEAAAPDLAADQTEVLPAETAEAEVDQTIARDEPSVRPYEDLFTEIEQHESPPEQAAEASVDAQRQKKQEEIAEQESDAEIPETSLDPHPDIEQTDSSQFASDNEEDALEESDAELKSKLDELQTIADPPDYRDDLSEEMEKDEDEVASLKAQETPDERSILRDDQQEDASPATDDVLSPATEVADTSAATEETVQDEDNTFVYHDDLSPEIASEEPVEPAAASNIDAPDIVEAEEDIAPDETRSETESSEFDFVEAEEIPADKIQEMDPAEEVLTQDLAPADLETPEPADTEKEELTPLDCPDCKTRNFFSIADILAGAKCRNCSHSFLSAPVLEVKDKDTSEVIYDAPEVVPQYTRRAGEKRQLQRSGKSKFSIWLSVFIAAFILGSSGYYYMQKQKNDRVKQLYTLYITSGDSLFDLSMYQNAMSQYENALKYDPDAAYPRSQIDNCRDLIARAKAAEEAKLLQQAGVVTFEKKLQRADSLFDNRQYRSAKPAYGNLLTEEPENTHIQSRLAEIDQLLAPKPPPKVAERQPVRPVTVPSLSDLQAVIDKAAPGGRLELDAGIFKITEPLRILKSLTIVGAGPNHTLIISNTPGQAVIVENGAVLTASGIGIENENVQGVDIIAVQNGRVMFDNCAFKGATLDPASKTGGSGIVFDGTSNGTVSKSRFSENFIAVKAISASRPTLQDNEIWNNSTGVAVYDETRALVRENRIRANQNNGVLVSGNAQPTFEDNHIQENRANGILYETEGFSGKAQGNQITRNGEFGLVLTKQSQPIFENNGINLNNGGGVLYRDNSQGIIRKNKIENNKYWGIQIVNFAKPTVEANTIKGNTGDGIEVLDKAQPTIDSNVITKNGGDGISLLITKDGGHLRNNTCRGNQGYGISILKNARPSLLNNITGGNHEGNIYEEVAAN